MHQSQPNASGDGSLERLAALENVRLVSNTRNLGFARAANQGAALVEGRHVFFLNPDVRARAGSLEHLVQVLEREPSLAVLGGKLLNLDGSLQNSCRRFYEPSTMLVRRTPLKTLLPWLPANRRHLYLDEGHEQAMDVDWLIGACLLVRREALERLAGFDASFFLYLKMWICVIAHGSWVYVYDTSRARFLSTPIVAKARVGGRVAPSSVISRAPFLFPSNTVWVLDDSQVQTVLLRCLYSIQQKDRWHSAPRA